MAPQWGRIPPDYSRAEVFHTIWYESDRRRVDFERTSKTRGDPIGPAGAFRRDAKSSSAASTCSSRSASTQKYDLATGVGED
jgi:hypothetical protein